MKHQQAHYPPVAFVQHGYDRRSLYRARSRYLDNCLDDGSARLLFVYEGKVGLRRAGSNMEISLVDANMVPRGRREALTAVYLGEYVTRPVFAILCEEHPESLLALTAEPMVFAELRQASGLLTPHATSLLGYATAMDHWHRAHRFCGACGTATVTDGGGHVRRCSNPDCGRSQFPRTDPAVIVLVHDGDACLLGRKRDWIDRRYSTIAGYVEPGETPEQAVVREVYEETGAQVRKTRYYASQPWPFPGSLMLGYYARAERGEIVLHDNELQDARWFDREEIASWVPDGRLRLPSRISIAYRLLQHWFDEGADVPLDELNPDQP